MGKNKTCARLQEQLSSGPTCLKVNVTNEMLPLLLSFVAGSWFRENIIGGISR